MLLIISIMATEKIGKECIISTLREGNMGKAGKKHKKTVQIKST